MDGILETSTILFILTGTLVGFIGRWWMLRGDFRQYPTYPNGYMIHLTTGFIASAMGAVAYPALVAKNFVAVTFLALAIQQFREIRKMERESLVSLDKAEYAPRGEAYIDGIAKTFEARNYIVMVSALVTTVMAFVVKEYIPNKFAIIALVFPLGLGVIYLLKNYTKGHSLKDIVTIREAPLEFKDGNNLSVGSIYVMNIGLSATRDRILKNGLGVIMTPKGDSERLILNHDGQRKAIEHECARLLGLERYIATRRDFETGELALVIVPIKKDANYLEEIIYKVPILEINKKIQPGKAKS